MLILTVQPSYSIQNYLDVLNANGGGILNLNPVDTFYPGGDITLYSNTTINGNGGTIDFEGGAYGIKIEGTNLDNILNTGLSNLTVQNSTSSLIYGRYANTCNINNVFAVNGSVGFDFAESDGVAMNSWGVDTCTTSCNFLNVPNATFLNYSIYDSGTMILNGINNTSLDVWSMSNSVGAALSLQNCYNMDIQQYSILTGTSHGIEFISGNSDISLASGYITGCTGDGIKLTASSNRIGISEQNILSCTGYGINIASSSCNNAILVGTNTSGNSSGALNDSGTGTLKSATVNNFI